MKTKAAILREIKKPLSIEEIEIPKLEKGQVLIKILYSGICHSQINEINGLRGEDKYIPHLLGHEGSGIVEEVGESVTKVKKSDRVVLTWIKGQGQDVPSCKYFDVKGKIINSGAITTFSNYSIISENRLVKINRDIDMDKAALLGCAIPTGAGIIKNELILKPEQSVVIFGVGGIGASAIIYSVAIGCENIIAVDINDSKLDVAKSMGANYVINPEKENLIEKIKEYTKDNFADCAVECTGVPFVMESAIAAIKNYGKVVIAGNPKIGSTIKIDPYDLIKGKKIVGTWGGATNPDKDIPYYEKLIVEGKLDLDNLDISIVDFTEINDVISEFSSSNKIRVLLKMDK